MKAPETTLSLFGEDIEKEKAPDEMEQLKIKMLEEIYSTKKIEVKTDLNPLQIMAFSRAKLFASEFDCEIMSQFVDLIAIFSVSKGRKSRQEFTEIAKALNNAHSENEQEQKLSERLLGIK